MPCLSVAFRQLDWLVERRLPQLSLALRSEQLQPAMFASAWFITLFSSFDAMSPALVLRIWDGVVADGWSAVFGVSLAVLSALQVLMRLQLLGRFSNTCCSGF